MNYFAIGIGIITGFITLRWLIRYIPEYLQEQKELNERLKDETIYDPESGDRMNLEDASSGKFKNSRIDRTKTEDEITQNYRKEEQDLQRAINLLLKSGHSKNNSVEFPKKDDLLLFQKFVDVNFQDFSINKTDHSEFFFTSVYENTGNIHGEYEYQILVKITLDQSYGHYYFRPKTLVEGILDKIKSDDVLSLSGFEPMCKVNTDKKEQLEFLLAPIAKVPDLVLEVNSNCLYLKSTLPASELEMKRILNLTNTLEKQLLTPHAKK